MTFYRQEQASNTFLSFSSLSQKTIMPIAQAGDKVLVTGANGYIAIWVVRFLLEKGYSVVGQVRSEDKGKYLTEYFASYGDRFSIAVVKDITAVRGRCS